MATGKPHATLGLEAQHSRVQNAWYSATRQAERERVRMSWARNVLKEESIHPLTHSAALVRLAQNILAAPQTGSAT